MINFFTSKVGLIISVLTLLYLATDINDRFAKKINSSNKAADTLTIETLSIPQISKLTVSTLEQVYKQYQIKKEVPLDGKNNEEMSGEEQAKQSGYLQSFYIDDNKLQLKSIIKNDQQLAVALILVTNVKSSVSKVEPFINNSQAYGYKLTIENNTQVTFTSVAVANKQPALNKTAQKVTLSMYNKQ